MLTTKTQRKNSFLGGYYPLLLVMLKQNLEKGGNETKIPWVFPLASNSGK